MGVLNSFEFAGTMRRRILLYLVCALVPMIALSFYLAFDERREEEARARSDETSAVNTVKADLDNLFRLSRGLVSGLSYQKGSDREICDSLAPLRTPFPGIFNFGIIQLTNGDTQAHMLCAAVPPGMDPFPLTPEETLLTDSLRPGDLRAGSIRNNIVDGRPVIPIAGLMSNAPDGTQRLAVVTLSLDEMGKQLSRVHLPGDAILLVLDRHGVIAARSPVSQEWAIGKPAPEFERTLPERTDFAGEITGGDGISRFYAVAHAGGGGTDDGLTVILKTRTTDIFRQSRIRLILHLAGLLIVSLIVFGIAWSNSNRYVARPLMRLADVADRLAKGNLGERSGVEYEGEMGILARSFDRMAECLQKEEIRSAHMLESLRALTARLDSVSEDERTRIARELHDELGQHLTAMRFELSQLEEAVGRGGADAGAQRKVQDLNALIDTATRDVRRIATDLRPVALEFGGLVDAIRFLAEDFETRTGISCSVQVPEPVDAESHLANALYRICQESLTNVARHANASEVAILLLAEPACLTLTIRDNGLGFVPEDAAQTNSLGLLGMKERARMAGGILSVISTPGEGTTILAWIPATDGTHAGDALAAFV